MKHHKSQFSKLIEDTRKRKKQCEGKGTSKTENVKQQIHEIAVSEEEDCVLLLTSHPQNTTKTKDE